jgi:hypothetical protein
MEHRFFISHSSADRDFVTWLANELKTYCIPVWYSDWEIKVGDSITGKIGAALEEMAGLIIVLSASSIRSKWVREEFNAGLARHLDSQCIPIFPIRIDNCAIPPLLAHRRYADFSTDKNRAIRELVEALVPDTTLLANIQSLKAECKYLLDQIEIGIADRNKLRSMLGQINDLLEKAVDARYAIEIRKEENLGQLNDLLEKATGGRYSIESMKDDERVKNPASFFERFDYLVQRGYDLRNHNWGMLVLLRNIYVHPAHRSCAHATD